MSASVTGSLSNWKLADVRRLFVSYEPPPHIVDTIHAFQEEHAGPNLFPERQPHVTIAFMGNTDMNDLPIVVDAVTRGIQDLPVPVFSPGEYQEGIKIGWHILQEQGASDQVAKIWLYLWQALGFKSEYPDWLAHLTIFRYPDNQKPNLQPGPVLTPFSPTEIIISSSSRPIGDELPYKTEAVIPL